MKKMLLSILILFVFVNVNASMKDSISDIEIENVEIKASEKIGYNEELKVKFMINPRDDKNLELSWKIDGLVNGVTAELKEEITNVSDGEIIIKINNTLDKNVKLTLKSIQNGKVYSSTELNVESKNNTIERIKEEVSNLIVNLDEQINKNNYEENKEVINQITDLLENNDKVKEMLKQDLLIKYENVKTNIEEYKENSNTLVIIVAAGFIMSFSFLLYWIFKKETN